MNRNKRVTLLAVAMVFVLAVCLTIGGTLAFMQESTGTVTNTFKAGEITYTLNLEPNAQHVNHENNEVTMPAELAAVPTSDLEVEFRPDVVPPTLTGYTFGGWYLQAIPEDKAPDASMTPFTDTTAVFASMTLYAYWIPKTAN